MSTPNTYDVGDLIILTGRFFSDAAQTAPADPTAEVVRVKDPLGVTTTPVVTKTGTGVYTAPLTPANAGMYEIRWEGTGAVQAVAQERIFVRRVNTA